MKGRMTAAARKGFGIRVLAALLGCSLLWGCDPGCSYRPLGWTKAGNYKWRFSNADLQVDMFEPGGLIGQSSLDLEPEVTNFRNEPLIFESGVLETPRRKYTAEFGSAPNTPDSRWRTVPPRSSLPVLVAFELSGPLPEALGRTPRLTLRYRVGNGRLKSIVIQLESTEPVDEPSPLWEWLTG
jgi:hypothetical protein